MPGIASYEPSSAPRSYPPGAMAVYRYQSHDVQPFHLLPNIRVLGIQYREGPDPGLARFRYVMGGADPSTDPTGFEQALSVDIVLPNVVQNDDRLVVVRFNPDGSTCLLFDGFAQVPELTLSPSQELVTFVAYGVAVREWDTPVGGALIRNMDDPKTGKDVVTALPASFNLRGRPNATPDGADAVDPFGNRYPSFVDPLVVRDPDVRRYWTLSMASRFLCFHGNPDQRYVANPDGLLIDSLLDSRSPRDGVVFDPGDPVTYTSEPILVPEFVCTDKPWPVALAQLLEPHGFGMAFRLESDDAGLPRTRLEIFRKQDGSVSSYKDLLLQPAGQPLDPSQTNVAAAHLARDTTGIANVYTVAGAPLKYEASFILAPGFSVNASDAADAAAIRSFDRNSPSFSRENHDKYRIYIFDETGEGHWDFTKSTIVRTATSLDALFKTGSDPVIYVKRRRVASGELLTRDPNGKPLRARLAISTDYKGGAPGLWDGSGTWQQVVGGFELLHDRLGIWINVPNPNGWNIGAPVVTGMPFPSGVVRGIETQATGGSAPFVLRLTCVIEGDEVVSSTAGQRPSSATSFSIARRVDASQRYFKHLIGSHSEFNTGTTPLTQRDDTTAADAEACARRLAGEAGEVLGSVTIPRFTAAYRIGDKIRAIRGRDLSLRTNAGAPDEEGLVFPTVVGLNWEFENRLLTTLQLSDCRGDSR